MVKTMTTTAFKILYENYTQGKLLAPKVEYKQSKALEFVAHLKQCIKTRDLSKGQILHKQAMTANVHADKYVAAALITMYSKCSHMLYAQQVFHILVQRDVVIWNSLILGYVENGQNAIALELFTLLDCQPSPVTFVAGFKACGGLSLEMRTHKLFCLGKGIAIHKRIKALGFYLDDVILSNTLVVMYGRCGSMRHAREVFNGTNARDVVTWNSLIQAYVENGDSSTALDLFLNMGCSPTSVTYVAALKACGMLASERDSDAGVTLGIGIGIHQLAKDHGYDHDLIVSNSLVAMYTRLRDMQRARDVFEKMFFRSDSSWNSLMLGYVENGEENIAMDLFSAMDCDRSSVTFSVVLKACGGMATLTEKRFCLFKGVQVHKEIRKRGLESNVVVVNSLAWMYIKCGSVRLAREVVHRMNVWNVVTWNSILTGCVENGEYPIALDLFTEMDCEPNTVTYTAVLKSYGSLARERKLPKEFCLERVILIHEQIRNRGLDTSLAVGNALVDVYCKCSNMQLAKEVSDGMTRRDVVTWTLLILGYTENGDSFSALEVFDTMDCEPSPVTYIAALKACGASACLKKGMSIHKHMNRRGLISDVTVSTTLLDMYTKCGDMQRARDVLEGMSSLSVASWTSLILGYVRNGECMVAVDVFANMDCEPSSLTYVALLKACGGIEKQAALRMVTAIHKHVKSRGLDSDTLLTNTLVDMYTKCGNLPGAKEVFYGMTSRDVVTWNCLLLGYLENREFLLALELFSSMDCEPSSVTFIAVLKAYGCLASERGTGTEKEFWLEKCVEIHKRVKERGLESNVVLANTLVDVYGRCRSMDRAREVFDRVAHRDAVTWTSLIQGYVENNESNVALELFSRMDCEPDALAYVSVLKACTSLAELSAGKRIHATLCRLGLENSPVVVNVLMDFYVKCSCMSVAEQIFLSLESPDIVSWNVLIAGCSSCRDPSQVLSLVRGMEETGLEMNAITFTSVLVACSHAGLLQNVKVWFESISSKLGFTLTVEHYNGIVDALSRANRLQEALDVAKDMPFEPNIVTLRTLLSSSHKDVAKAAQSWLRARALAKVSGASHAGLDQR